MAEKEYHFPTMRYTGKKLKGKITFPRVSYVKGKKSRKLSSEAKKFIARKVRKNIEEGREPKQAVAIAYSQARAEGYKVPSRRKLRGMS